MPHLSTSAPTQAGCPVVLAFGVRVLINVGLVVLGGWLLRFGGGQVNRANALFFVLLLSLITLLDDRYRPVYQARFRFDP
jgi:hypothetical protein